MLDGEAQLRRGAQRVEQIHANALLRQHARGILGELPREAAAVVRDGHALLARVRALRDQLVAQTRRRAAHGVYVHAVRARAQNAAQAARAEFEILVKTILNLLLIARNRRKLLLRLLVQPCVVYP